MKRCYLKKADLEMHTWTDVDFVSIYINISHPSNLVSQSLWQLIVGGYTLDSQRSL